MTSDPRDPGAMGEDDLFDLPTDAVSANELTDPALAASGAGVEIPLPPLPRRPERAGPAGPPLPNVPSTVDAILGQVRKRPAKTDETAAIAAEEPVLANARIQLPRAVWIALGGLAIVNVAVLAFVLGRPAPDRAADTEGLQAVPTSIVESPTPIQPATSVQEPRAPLPSLPPVLPGGSVLERAKQTLADARADIESGRRGSARARLGRLGLAIDGMDPATRESIRAEIGLLLAESTQADADEARRPKR